MPFKIVLTAAALCCLLTVGCAAKKQIVEKPTPEAKAKVMETIPAEPVEQKAAKVETPAGDVKNAVTETKTTAPVERKVEKMETIPRKEAGAATPKVVKVKEAQAFDDWITALNRELTKPVPATLPPAEKVMKGETVSPPAAMKEIMKPAAPVREVKDIRLAAKKTAKIEEKAQKKSATLKSLKVKVLSGEGNLASAKDMSRRLAKMGYKISNVDLASKSSFEGTTIYFAKGYEEAAKRMAEGLGEKTIRKPLTWKSVFHLIVVTGK